MKNLYYNSSQVLKLNYFWLDSLSSSSSIDYEDQSPELIRLHTPHVSTDIWNIGIVLYELTHGIHPFRGVSDYETCQKIMKEEKIAFGNYLSDDLIEMFHGIFEKDQCFRWYFKEIFQCDWFRKYQSFYGFQIKIDVKEFNSPGIKNKIQSDDDESDESVQFKKTEGRRNSASAEANSAYMINQRTKTKCLFLDEFFLFFYWKKKLQIYLKSPIFI